MDDTGFDAAAEALGVRTALAFAPRQRREQMTFAFEDHVLDPERCELRRGGDLIPVEPQVFDLILYLIRNRDRVVSKDDLFRSIWNGRLVSESALTTRINAARRALNDNGQQQRLIRTVVRKGFRFVGTVRECSAPSEPWQGSVSREPVNGREQGQQEPAADSPPASHTMNRAWMGTVTVPETRYARAGAFRIAYQVIGNGPRDLLVVPGWISNIEVFWEDPNITRFLRKLAGFSRLIVFDKRGTGLSDRGVEAATLEERMDDVRAVLDAVGSQRAALLGYSEGGSMCTLFAATYPQRTAALITIGGYARRLRAPDYPYFATREESLAVIDAAADAWGGPVWIDLRMPSVAADPVIRQWWARFVRMSASASGAASLQRLNLEIDLRHILGSIRVPTLMLQSSGDRVVPAEAGRYMAERIPGARFVEIDSGDHLPFYDKPDVFIDHLRTFLTEAAAPETSESRVVTLMFIDIVGLTRLAPERGKPDFANLQDTHHAAIRRELALHRGDAVNTAGTGLLASFDGPARAITCALAIVKSLDALGISCRIGLHTGECAVRGHELQGMAMHIAAHIAALAAPGTVRVSQTVRDLVAGSGIRFADAGSHGLKGLPEQWRLFEVAAS